MVGGYELENQTSNTWSPWQVENVETKLQK